jgi:hypothetical protein
VTQLNDDKNPSLVVAYWRYEKEKLSRVSEIKSAVRKIVINPKS